MDSRQDKTREVAFFDEHAAYGDYDVFEPESSRRLLRRCLELVKLEPPAFVADLGCASGVFAGLLDDAGFEVVGVDLSPQMVALARRIHPGLRFEVGDIERLPLPDGSLDAVLLSGVLHHLPDMSQCLREVHRVLKPGGRLMAFDPNRLNPFMYLYRDRSSPFYSQRGVTPNERPVLAREVRRQLGKAGFEPQTAYLGGLQYRYVASRWARWFLPAYNLVDRLLFLPSFLTPFRQFVLTAAIKPLVWPGAGPSSRGPDQRAR